MNKLRPRRATEVILALLLVGLIADVTPGYSVLTHEALVDSMWEFKQGFDATVNSFRQSLSEIGTDSLNLQNKNLDTGRPASAGEYRLADNAYAQILNKLASHKFENVPPELRENILAFYGDANTHIAIKRDSGEWQKTLRALAGLRSAGVSSQSPTSK